MWYLNRLTSTNEVIYRDKFLVDLKKRLAKLDNKILDVLMPGGKDDKIKALLIAQPETLYPLNDDLEQDLVKNGQWTNEAKDAIFSAFNYDGVISRNSEISYWLAGIIGRNTCPYCNRLYTITIAETSTKAHVVRPDFDHWLDKAKHPLLSLSLYNLIPTCQCCNRSIKNQQHFMNGEHVHPYVGTEPSFHFEYVLEPGNHWSVKMIGMSSKEKATDEILHVEDAYRTDGDLEVRDMVEFFRCNTPEYLADLYEKVLHGNSSQISQEEAFRLFMGAEWDSENYLDRPLSQLKKDIFSQLVKDVACIKVHDENDNV